MKLSHILLAAIVQNSESAVTCPNGNDLFETSCSSDGFEIIINEDCRSSTFKGIDFKNSFLWGDMSETNFGNIDTSTCQGKPSSDVNTLDNDGNQAWKWTVPFLDCATTPTIATNKITYDIYWNSNSAAGDDQILQMGQVKLTCDITLDPFQVDASPISILEDTMVDDVEVTFDIHSLVSLKVYNHGPEHSVNSKTNFLQDGSDNTQVQSLTYNSIEATEASLGDHIELRLSEDIPGTFDDYSLSLINCWSSKDEVASVNGQITEGSGATPLQVNFWDDFCPAYDWVGPEPDLDGNSNGNGYLREVWDMQSSIHAVHFRQFAFLSDSFDINSDSIYYHCTVKACDKSEEQTCSTLDLSGNAVTCNPFEDNSAPARRKRSADAEIIEADPVQVSQVSLQDCEVNSEDGTVCYERKRSDPSNSDIEGESDNSESSSESLGVAMMLLTLAALNLN